MATKEKESTVMRYAISEKAVIEQKSIREQTERKLVEALKEKDLLQHKLAAMVQEKARICQLLDNKVINCFFTSIEKKLLYKIFRPTNIKLYRKNWKGLNLT